MYDDEQTDSKLVFVGENEWLLEHLGADTDFEDRMIAMLDGSSGYLENLEDELGEALKYVDFGAITDSWLSDVVHDYDELPKGVLASVLGRAVVSNVLMDFCETSRALFIARFRNDMTFRALTKVTGKAVGTNHNRVNKLQADVLKAIKNKFPSFLKLVGE